MADPVVRIPSPTALRAAAAALAMAACGLPAGSPALAQEPERHLVNLRDADIQAYIDDVSVVTGHSFIVHPAVRGQVTVTSQQALTPDEVFEVFLATLRVHGYAALPAANGAYKIVPDQTAAEASRDFADADVPLDQFVTDVIRLDYFDAAEAAETIRPLVNGRGQVTVNERSNMIVVVDYAGNVNRIRQLVEEMDQDRSQLATVSLSNMPAADVARLVTELGRDEDVAAVAVQSNNSVVLRGDPSTVGRFRTLAQGLDASSAPTESLRVVYLRHADAADIVPILETVARSMSVNGAAQEISIPFHAPTNALILSAEPQTLSALVRVVEELDVRRAQVLVEAIIVEISDDAARELGLQFVLSGQEDSSLPFAASNFSRSAPNVLALTGALALDEDDLGGIDFGSVRDAALNSLLGVNGGVFGVGGQTDDGGIFGVILNALQSDFQSNILSTPSIMTLDNEPASILVGQEIPITTGEALGSNNQNPFRTIERKDVGVQLEVEPQINEGDAITLKIRQEVSTISASATSIAADLVTNKREIVTTVLADDGEVIVLGGLIENSESVTSEGIPILSDIPLAGRLFSSEGTSQVRTNLMVFIRPTIVRSPNEARDATSRSYQSALEGVANSRLLDTDASLSEFVEDMLGSSSN